MYIQFTHTIYLVHVHIIRTYINIANGTYIYILIAQERPMSVSGVSRSLAKLSFNHPSVVLTAAAVFHFFIKILQQLYRTPTTTY